MIITCVTQNWNIALNTASPSTPLPRVSRPLVNAWKTIRSVVRHSVWPPDCFREEIQFLHFQLPGTYSCQPLSSLGFLSFQTGQDDTESYIIMPLFHILFWYRPSRCGNSKCMEGVGWARETLTQPYSADLDRQVKAHNRVSTKCVEQLQRSLHQVDFSAWLFSIKIFLYLSRWRLNRWHNQSVRVLYKLAYKKQPDFFDFPEQRNEQGNFRRRISLIK